MIEHALDGLLAGVFLVAAVQKVARPRASSSALATYGLSRASLRAATLVAVVGAELALAAGILAGVSPAAWAGAALMLGFAGLAARALRAGHAGAPCACFGPGSRLSWWSVARNVLLAAALALRQALPAVSLGVEAWLGVGLAVALGCVLMLAVAVSALAREVGMLRRELVPAPALELPDEGPALGIRTALIERFAPGPRVVWALAVFSSEGCALCQALEASVGSLARDPLLALEVFDEQRDALVWRALKIPGSPFAVAMSRDGRVLAKGTFNSRAQLEGILGAAERRAAESRPAWARG